MAEFLRGGLVDGRGGQEEDDRFRRNIWVQIFFPQRISHVRDAVISHVRRGGGKLGYEISLLRFSFYNGKIVGGWAPWGGGVPTLKLVPRTAVRH